MTSYLSQKFVVEIKELKKKGLQSIESLFLLSKAAEAEINATLSLTAT